MHNNEHCPALPYIPPYPAICIILTVPRSSAPFQAPASSANKCNALLYTNLGLVFTHHRYIHVVFRACPGSGFQRDLLGYRCMAPVARLLRHTPADQLPTTASYDYPAPALKDEAGSLKDALSVPPPPATVGAKEAGEGDGVKGEEDRVSSDGSSGNAVEAKGV